MIKKRINNKQLEKRFLMELSLGMFQYSKITDRIDKVYYFKFIKLKDDDLFSRFENLLKNCVSIEEVNSIKTYNGPEIGRFKHPVILAHENQRLFYNKKERYYVWLSLSEDCFIPDALNNNQLPCYLGEYEL